jgi:hypothetical protein
VSRRDCGADTLICRIHRAFKDISFAFAIRFLTTCSPGFGPPPFHPKVWDFDVEEFFSEKWDRLKDTIAAIINESDRRIVH